MEEQILKRIYESLDKGDTVAMAVITDEIGSSPRKSGSIMAVWNDETTYGSVGGGIIEHTIKLKAIECIHSKEGLSFEYKLSDIGMQCGGAVKGYIKVFMPKPKLIIVGGGHIGEQVYQLAKVLGFYTVVIDDRHEFANFNRFPNSNEVHAKPISETLKEYPITENDYVVIATKGQATDQGALAAVINRKPAYIGMIGSARKVRIVMQELIESGISKELLMDVHAPMGLDISSNQPEEIAFGILAEILLVKNKGTLNHRKSLKKVWD